MTGIPLRGAIVGTALFFLASCGGGGGGDSISPPSGIAASFVPEEPNPSASTVAMAQASAAGDVVIVELRVTDTNGVYGAAFEVFFDSASVQYVNWSPGTLLEQGGNSPVYNVGLDPSDSGHLLVGASRTGNVPGADASGSRPLIRLAFRARRAGSFPLSFANAALFDAQNPPASLSGISWFAGSVVGT
jgi:hypothetical protein